MIWLIGLWLGTAFPALQVYQDFVLSPKEARFENPPQYRTQPIVLGDILYYALADGRVGAFHRELKYKLWEISIPSKNPINGCFAYGRSKLFVGDIQGNFYAFQARNGELVWQVHFTTQWLSAPTIYKDKVFAMGSNNELFVFGERDGSDKWHFSRKNSEKMTIWGASQPAVFGSEVYVGFSDGYLFCLSGADGKIVWSKKLRSKIRFGDIDLLPFVDEKMVIAATYDGNLYALDRLTGASLWMLKVGTYGDFWVESSKVYLSGLDGFVYALDQSNGNILWKTALEGHSNVGMSPSKVGKFIVVPTSSDPIYFLHESNGEIAGKYWLGAGTFGKGVAVSQEEGEGQYFVVSNYGNWFALNIKEVLTSRFGMPEGLSLPSAILHDGVVRDVPSFLPRM